MADLAATSFRAIVDWCGPTPNQRLILNGKAKLPNQTQNFQLFTRMPQFKIPPIKACCDGPTETHTEIGIESACVLYAMQQRGNTNNRRSRSFSRSRIAVEGS